MHRFCFLALALMPAAWAEQPGAIDVRGSIGATVFADEGLDEHLQTGFSVRFYVTRHLSFEPEFQYLRASSLHHDIALVPNVNWDFREGCVGPYVTGGVGLLRATFRNFRPTYTDSQFFAQVGTGVKLYVTDRWYLAPEFRVGSELHARVNAVVGYTFRR